jgi:UDP-glucuronate 4-epimerase
MRFENERILVTGSAGFIGSHVAERLVKNGAAVIGVDNLDPYYDIARKQENHAALSSISDTRFTPIEMDITDSTRLGRAMREHRATGVIHLAAKAGVRPSIVDPTGYATANVVGTQSVLSAASACGCSRVVCASSSSVYGNNEKTPFSETDSVEHPISPYAATKRACELVANTHHHLTQIPTAMLRFFTVFGPRQRPDLAISLFLNKIARGETIKKFGDGTSSRDYTYVDDIVTGVLSAYEHISDYGYRIWNLGGDDPITLNDLIATIERVVGKRANIEQMGMQAGDVDRTWADLSRSRNELGYTTTTSIEDGIISQHEWMQESGLMEHNGTGP